MKFIQLQHDVAFNMPKEDELLSVPSGICDKYKDKDGVFFTFRSIPHNISHIVEDGINACTRFRDFSDSDIYLFFVEEDTTLASCIIWDIAHKLRVGQRIFVFNDSCTKSVLCRDYYKDCFEMKTIDGCVVFKKIAQLTIESDRGLDRWTFGIPTGPGDATFLNAIVKRILELKCAEKEIILCGRPGANFEYWENVKIVGEDIPAPPIQISKKKNCIAENATFENICILHDRVFLPVDFMEAMERYGDDYSVITLQSIYFEDRENRLYHRYSDYNTIGNHDLLMDISRVANGEEDYKNILLSPTLRKYFDGTFSFYYQSALNCNDYSYVTGSLFIVKKSLILRTPLDNQLLWNEYEDVEWGLRCNSEGIPHRINPYTISQSIVSRPLILNENGILYLTPNNKTENLTIPHSCLKKYSLKPVFKENSETVWKKFFQFKEKYCPVLELHPIIITPRIYLKTVMQLLNHAQFELETESVESFVKDVETMLLISLSNSQKEYIKVNLFKHNNLVMYDIFSMAINTFNKRPDGVLLAETLREFSVKYSRQFVRGVRTTSRALAKQNKKCFYHPDGYKGFFSSIMNSTPFEEYFIKN